MKFRRSVDSSDDSGDSQIPEDAVFVHGRSTRVCLTLRRDTPPGEKPEREEEKAEERTPSPNRGGKGGKGQRRPRRPGESRWQEKKDPSDLRSPSSGEDRERRRRRPRQPPAGAPPPLPLSSDAGGSMMAAPDRPAAVTNAVRQPAAPRPAPPPAPPRRSQSAGTAALTAAAQPARSTPPPPPPRRDGRRRDRQPGGSSARPSREANQHYSSRGSSGAGAPSAHSESSSSGAQSSHSGSSGPQSPRNGSFSPRSPHNGSFGTLISHNGSFVGQQATNGSFGRRRQTYCGPFGAQDLQGGSFARPSHGGPSQPDPPPPVQDVACPASGNDERRRQRAPGTTGRRGRQRAARSGPVPVKRMHFVDAFGDSGLYTGEVDDDSRPHGSGFMKYDNGIYYEGKWDHGRKDDSQGGGSQTRDRIMGGFTCWRSSSRSKSRSKSRSRGGGGYDDRGFVYGMDWVDVMGRPGKYTGEVSPEDEPNGKGVMRYEMGLVAEGEWIKGVLNDGSGITRANAAATVAGAGMSVAPGGMSVVGGGAASVVSGLGTMSIGGSNLMALTMMGIGQPPQQFHRQQSYPHQMQQHHPPDQAVGPGVPMFCVPPHNGQRQF